MWRKRRDHLPELKEKVALAAIKNEKTLAERKTTVERCHELPISWSYCQSFAS